MSPRLAPSARPSGAGAPLLPASRRRAGTPPLRALLALALVASVVAAFPSSTSAQAEPGTEPGVEHEMVVETLSPALDVVATEDAPVAEVSAAVLEPVGETTTSATRAPERQVTSSTDEEPFSMIGVGFEGGVGEAALVRVLQADETWSDWIALEVGGHEGEGAVEQPADDGQVHVPNSEPIWVEDAHGYEVDLPANATSVQVHLVREGDEVVELAGENSAAAIGPAAGQPAISSRAAWGAAPYRGTPDMASSLSFAVVHHTVNSNGYSQASVPSMIRGIQSYHQDSNGWSDIGYNFVVDRFGTIWEGRQGGVANPVIGAHAANANTGSVGTAVLGDFTSAAPPEVVINRLQTIVGWKLALYGVSPNANNVLGHRQAGTTQTACPGQALFNRMGDIRYGALLYYNTISDPCYGSSYEPFCDVSPQHQFFDEIMWVADHGIADGYADGTFRPGAAVSRQAMSAFLYRLSDTPAFTPAAGQRFNDVGRSSPFFKEIEWLNAEGIGTGYSDGGFHPLASVSRQAMSAFMYRAAGSPPYTAPVEPEFTDVEVGRPFYDEIHWLDAESISNGYTDGTFRPDAPVTRQAMAAFLQRLDPLV